MGSDSFNFSEESSYPFGLLLHFCFVVHIGIADYDLIFLNMLIPILDFPTQVIQPKALLKHLDSNFK